MSLLRIPLCTGAFALGLLGAAALGSALMAPPHLSVLSEKRAHLLADAEHYDTIFIGSSRVYRGIVPAVFDDEMRALGQPTRSFNFAMDGVWPPESFSRVRELLRDRVRARWVFIELLPVNPRLQPESARTLRSIYWHDWHHTLLAWRSVAEIGSFSAAERWSLAALHAELLLRNFTQLSRATTLLAPRLLPELEKSARRDSDLDPPWLAGRGFLAEPEREMPAATALAYRGELAAYEQRLETRPLPPALRDEVRELTNEVRATGAVPIFFITPSTSRAENFSTLRAQGIDADLVSLKDPARFPALFDPSLHFDGPHLNERGARELSRTLAREAAPWLGYGSGGSAR